MMNSVDKGVEETVEEVTDNIGGSELNTAGFEDTSNVSDSLPGEHCFDYLEREAECIRTMKAKKQALKDAKYESRFKKSGNFALNVILCTSQL